MSQVKTIGQAISLTGKYSDVADVSKSTRELLTVHVEMSGALTAFDFALEGRFWTPEIEVSITDNADADVEAFFAGELVEQAGGAAIAVGQRFIVDSSDDLNDNALQTAKGGAPADGDIFQVIDIGTEAVAYVPNHGFATIQAFDEADTAWIIQIPFAPFIRVRTHTTWTASEILGVHIDY